MSTPLLLRGDARALPLADESVDLIVTSPPYFGLRDYGTTGQVGAEPTPQEFLDALIECTAEMVRVLKPSGSIFVNLGDKYNSAASGQNLLGKKERDPDGRSGTKRYAGPRGVAAVQYPQKSLHLLPERYRIRAVDDLGLVARAVLVWSKPNGLPESVKDRVRRSHEDWVHLTKLPRYFAAVDAIREPITDQSAHAASRRTRGDARLDLAGAGRTTTAHALGKLPGSVWTVPSQPLNVPAELGADHFAAFPMEWPRRLIQGWCPSEVCTACGEGRRPVTAKGAHEQAGHGGTEVGDSRRSAEGLTNGGAATSTLRTAATHTITGYACACPGTSAPSTPGVVLDPFGGTGTTALVATMLGRRGISVDLSADYQRIATWRANDPKQRARATQLPKPRPEKPAPAPKLFEELLTALIEARSRAELEAIRTAAAGSTDWAAEHDAVFELQFEILGEVAA